MHTSLITGLIPVLARPPAEDFNIFRVMHHGSHEKQLSNVFAWLLDSQGSHHLGDVFQRIFLEAVNLRLTDGEPIPAGEYSVRQEVNTSGDEDGMDIADLVLEDHATSLVIENYHTSSGHGHGYETYRAFGARGDRRSVVVLMCQTENRGALIDGWDKAVVVTYAELLQALHLHVAADHRYRTSFPEQSWFFQQMHQRFVKGWTVDDQDLVEFLEVMCRTGEAKQYQMKNNKDAAIDFADRLRDSAVERFMESRELLARIKRILRDYGQNTVMPQMNAALGEDCVEDVSARFQGIYEWTINFHMKADESGKRPTRAQIKFGPSAWRANEIDKEWVHTVPAADADYTRLFITCRKEVRQSSVSLLEVLDGLASDDRRLSEELIQLVSEAPFETLGDDVVG